MPPAVVDVEESGSPTDEAVHSGDGVGVDAGDQSVVLDACQLRTGGARDVHAGEGAARDDEAVLVARGVVQEPAISAASLIPNAVVLAASGKAMGLNTLPWSRKPCDPVVSDQVRRCRLRC